jgi:hypothetical protein
MLRLRRRRGAVQAAPPIDMIADLERLLKRGLVFPVLVPFLLATGVGVGKLTHRALTLPEDTPVRIASGREVSRSQLEALSHVLERAHAAGERTAGYIEVYGEHIAPVEESLRRRGVPAETAREIAWPLVEYAYRRSLDPATVLAVLLIESEGNPRATSPVGARGLMQVMPWWSGRVEGCGRDLYDIADNLCHGTWILAEAKGRFRTDERRALLAYNGCVHGTFTPDCHRYPDKVYGIRRQIVAEWERMRAAKPAEAAD